MFFTTNDRDNDGHSGNCADIKNGGWWHNAACAEAFLTGTYDASDLEFRLRWGSWTLSDAEMKIRRKSIVNCVFNKRNCFYWTKKSRSWIDAVDECRGFNADLPSAVKESWNVFLADYSASVHSIDEIYLGMGMGNTAKWTDGVAVDYNLLTGGLPGTSCVVLRKDQSWAAVDCHLTKQVVCQRAQYCFRGDCYVVNENAVPKTHSSAEEKCTKRGYVFAKISTAEDHQYAMKVLRVITSDSSIPSAFISLKLVGSEYVWKDGTKLQYNHWSPNEPTGNGEYLTAITESGIVDVGDTTNHCALCEKIPIARSCGDVRKFGRSENGYYAIHTGNAELIKAYCDLSSADGPWTVIQRRIFNTAPLEYPRTSWAKYRDGFGDSASNFWLGNKHVHELTKIPHRLKIVLYTEFLVYEAIYEDFSIGDEASKFVLNFGSYSGTAGDSLSFHRGMKFSTLDEDNDLIVSGAPCTNDHPGGWWFANCLESNLNGVFDQKTNNLNTLYWKTISQPVMKTEMKIQAYQKVPDLLPSGMVQNEIALLGFTFREQPMKITVQTPHQQWTVKIPSPGPFTTHVAVTWEDDSYLRYYENGTLLAEVSAVADPSLKFPNIDASSLPYAWLNELSLFDQRLTKSDVQSEYQERTLTFEEDGHLWSFKGKSSYNWDIIKGCTPSNLTGPCADHTYLRNVGSYAYAEASLPARYGNQTFIQTPSVPAMYRCLSFWYHMYGDDAGLLNVYLTTNSSTPRVSVRNISGNHGNYWRYMEIDLNVESVFKIVFEAIRGNSFKSDIAIDDVNLATDKCKFECNPPCGPGQRCDHSTLLCLYEGIYDSRWTLDSLNVTVNTTHSTSGVVEETDGVIDGAVELKGNGKIVFQEVKSICLNAYCFPFYTVSFWLKYEEMTAQNILTFGDLLKFTQNKVTPENYISMELKSKTYRCVKNFFVPAEVWSHIIVVLNRDAMSLYLDGHLVARNINMSCVTQSLSLNYPQVSLMAGGSGDVNFGLDDVRMLFDVVPSDLIKLYKEKTGYERIIFVKARLTSQTWDNDLLNNESDAYIALSQLISQKVMETLEERSNIEKVVVERFRPGSVVADMKFVYVEVSHEDLLLVEEALLVNNSFNGLDVDPIAINTSSVPNHSPIVIGAHSPNSTTLWLNWTEISSLYLNGVFQGYKVLYRETENSSHSKYSVEVVYGNHSEVLLTDLEPLMNYTLRVLAFTLSGDGFLSDALTAFTIDGLVVDSSSIALTSKSSTAIHVEWTRLPNSTVHLPTRMRYRRLLGYHLYSWKKSDIKSSFAVNVTVDNQILAKDLEKWMEYCFNVSGYTSSGIGPASGIQCTRTLEDAPEKSPSNVTVEIEARSLKLDWSPPPSSAVPGIIRHYNLSYRVMNISDSETISLTLSGDDRSRTLSGLTPYSLYQVNISAFTVSTGPSHSVFVMTEQAAPSAAPGNVSLLNMSSTALEVNWTALSKPFHHGVLLGYRIIIWKQSDGEGSSFNTTVSHGTFFKQFQNLSKWTFYCVQVTAFNIIDDGPRSAAQCSRTFEDAPEAAPSNLTAVNVTESNLHVQWSPPPVSAVPGIIRHYNLSYRNLNYSDDRLTQLSFDATVTSHKLENLIGLTMYEINVTSSTIRLGPSDSILVLTKEGVPSIAPNVSWHNESSTSLRVHYHNIPRPLRNGILLGYRIFMWKQSDGQVSEVDTTVAHAQPVRVFENLEKWTHYCGQVAGFTRIGDGPRSPVQCIRTSEDAPEMPPTNVNTSNITWSSFYLTWNPINPSFIPGILRSYRITYKIMDPGFGGAYDGSFLVDGQATSVNVTGLIGLTNYEVMVNGFTVKDGPGNVTYLQTEEGVPTAPPDQINTTDLTSTTITLAWQKILLPERHGIVKGYQLTYKKSGERTKREAEETLTFQADEFSAFLFKLTPYTNYTITLAGFTSKGLGRKKVLRIETMEGSPKVSPKLPYGVNFTGPTTIFIGWGPLTTAELQGRLVGYEVRYRVFSVADEIVFNPPPEVVRIIYSEINGIRITGLSTYTTYTVSVSALSGGGTGVSSRVLYVATCRCFKTLYTNYWNYQPYTNISTDSSFWGFFPHLLDMVTLSCCQTCLEHGTSEIDYFHDGEGNPSLRSSDIDVKRSLSLKTDFSFPVYGFNGQTTYSKYYGFATIVEVVGTAFFTKKPDYSLTQGNALLDSVMSIVPFLAIAVIFAYIAGVILWALECGSNEDEYPKSFFRGAACGFWWAYITMTTVGYGDKTARTRAGRVFAVVWVLVGLCISSLLIGTISSAFTSSATVLGPPDTILYGATVAALHDSPDHKLGVRRNAKVNTFKKYWSLEELRKDVLNEKVDGILVDTYVADSRRDLFSDPRLLITKVVDLRASYGVVMGRDATKLRKCFHQFWKQKAAVRSHFIEEHVEPVTVSQITSEELISETFNPQGHMYSMTLTICLSLLCLGAVCGSVYELIRRHKLKAKVEPEDVPSPRKEDLKQEMSDLLDTVREKIKDLMAKHKHDIQSFVKVKQITKES